jgi:hypothetical protein
MREGCEVGLRVTKGMRELCGSCRGAARRGSRLAVGLLIPTLLVAGCGNGAVPYPGGEGSRDGAAEATPVSIYPDLAGFSGLPARPRANASSAFWEHWGDGRAELSGYRVTVTHYGAPRDGELSLIYVTEPHDRRTWIKDDDASGSDRVEVLKLIRNLRFQTGIYPYSVMASVFAPVDAWGGERFHPARLNLDVQEWCGSVTHRVWPGRDRLRSLRLSYFASEGETLLELPVPEGTVYEDALLIQLRELDGPFAGGGDWTGPLVRELWSLRTGRGPVSTVEARITRSEASRDGVAVTRFVLEAGDYRRTFDVESASPRRVLGWEASTGERAELLGTERLAYWQLNRPGDESHLEALGLGLPGPLMGADAAACDLPLAP